MSRLAIIPGMREKNLDDLATEWRAAKHKEDRAKEERLELEREICEALPAQAMECTEHYKSAIFKMAVSYGVTRKVDADMLSKAWTALTEEQREAFRWKPEVSLTGLRKLEGQAYQEVAGMITAAPSKPSVKVEVL